MFIFGHISVFQLVVLLLIIGRMLLKFVVSVIKLKTVFAETLHQRRHSSLLFFSLITTQLVSALFSCVCLCCMSWVCRTELCCRLTSSSLSRRMTTLLEWLLQCSLALPATLWQSNDRSIVNCPRQWATSGLHFHFTCQRGKQ